MGPPGSKRVAEPVLVRGVAGCPVLPRHLPHLQMSVSWAALSPAQPSPAEPLPLVRPSSFLLETEHF